jgi:bifunctional enzyme CysN/CysC
MTTPSLSVAVRSVQSADALLGERMPIVVTGHVDHGKSTIVGRLLADTGSLPQGKLEAVRVNCERNAKPFEYAFLLDALKDEQAQGITIDSARVFFKSRKRHYIIIDAPGHIEFLKNMVTGASRAHAALLVIDAREGIRENSRRHGYLLSMLGIRQIVVVVNKMDLVGFDAKIFDAIRTEYAQFLQRLDIEPASYVPVSGFHGDNIANRSEALGWYDGPTILEALDSFESERPAVDQPFRMPIQGVYKFTQQSDDRRIIAGTIDTGRLRPGDDVVFYPSGKKSRVRSIEAFNSPPQHEAMAPQATGFTLEEQIYVTRGELAARAGEPAPLVGTRIRVNLFWLGRSPLAPRRAYTLKLGAARVPARLEKIHARPGTPGEDSSCDRRSGARDVGGSRARRASRGGGVHPRARSSPRVRPRPRYRRNRALRGRRQLRNQRRRNYSRGHSGQPVVRPRQGFPPQPEMGGWRRG